MLRDCRNPNAALRLLAYRMQPKELEIAAALRHIATIRARLDKSFDISAVIRIGSHSRGTAIRAYSDVDLLAVLRRREARWGRREVSPDSFIGRIADDLRERYVETSIRRDAQAVVLKFRAGQHAVDLVPGLFERFNEDRFPVFRIPGGSNEWIETSPAAHNKLFRLASLRSGGKLRLVSQLIKAWRFARKPPFSISSFYVDMLLASADIAGGVKSYGRCLYDFFGELLRRDSRSGGHRGDSSMCSIKFWKGSIEVGRASGKKSSAGGAGC
jgi:predicted nucleotidyltransferase